MKKCGTCKHRKKLEQFHKNSRTKDGVSSTCKTCAKKRAAIWLENNKERARENSRKYQKTHKEKLKEYLKNYQIKNRSQLNELKKQYLCEHKEQRKETTAAYRARVKCSRTHFIKEILRTARSNARKKNAPFELNYNLIDSLLVAQKEKCALTGIIFSYNSHPDSRYRPHTPSIDRIDNKKSYSLDNIQIVCSMVNRAKNEYPQAVFDQMCRARVEKLNGN